VTTLFKNRTTDGQSAQHTISQDITTIVAGNDDEVVWERCRLHAEIETKAGSGEFVSVQDWDMRAPGVRNVVTNGAAGLKLRVHLLGTQLTDVTPNISVEAN